MEQRFVNAPAASQIAAGIEMLPPAGALGHECVEQHVTRTRIKSDGLFGWRTSAQDRNIRNAADVERDAIFTGVPEQ